MNPIPKEAMPVVEILRRDVPRPTEIPYVDGDTLRWVGEDDGCYCPMGLHPKSTQGTPQHKESFAGGVCSSQSVAEFADWWDGILFDDFTAAMSAIWPEVAK